MFSGWLSLAFFAISVVFPEFSHATQIDFPGVEIKIDDGANRQGVATALQIVIALTVLSVVPSLVIAATSFTRIIIVLSMLRHAFGMQETPPNSVLISLAIFLTIFTMAPVFQAINEQGLKPYLEGGVSAKQAMTQGVAPLKDFMIRQTREQDLLLMVEVSKAAQPKSTEDVELVHLVPAFMLSELKSAFQIGFVIFLPFLLIDLVVSSILMSMGMMMVPPVMISLPIKVLMFVLIDGWNLVLRSVIMSFH